MDADVVREMMARGMRALTGEADVVSAWRRLFHPSDIVGIKVNAVGYPWAVSSPAIVAEAVAKLHAVGVRLDHIYVYDRFRDQLDMVNYGAQIPPGVHLTAAEPENRGVRHTGGHDPLAYDPTVYAEADLFGQGPVQFHMMTLVSRTLTKIINVPVMKEHGATGVTGCLKNIAYGSFSDVGRTHCQGVSHTYSCVGTLAAVEPIRSRTVLQIMDGLRGIWHGGPLGRSRRYVFFPRRILLGTDPVAVDRLLLDIIDEERAEQGAVSIWNRAPEHVRVGNGFARDGDSNVNIMVREPGHVAYAAQLGLGVYERRRIRLEEIDV